MLFRSSIASEGDDDGNGIVDAWECWHFGHIGVNSCIKLGKALEPYNMAWLEDMIPWQFTEQWKQITDAIDVPTLTGEDIYLKEPFEKLCRAHAVDIIHPDLASSGGLLETKKIGDMAQEYGVAMAMHFAGSPICCMANGTVPGSPRIGRSPPVPLSSAAPRS